MLLEDVGMRRYSMIRLGKKGKSFRTTDRDVTLNSQILNDRYELWIMLAAFYVS